MRTHAKKAGILIPLGRLAMNLGRDVYNILDLLRRSLAALGRMEVRGALGQAYELANRSIFFVVVIMGFTGAIMVLQASAQAQRIIGDLTIIGPNFLRLLLREFGPTIAAFMLAARYGAGVAAQLAAMTITEQVDALRMTGADPPAYLVAPRVVGGVIGCVPIVVLGTAVAYAVGGVAAHHIFCVGWDTYFSLRTVAMADVATGVAKTLSYGAAVPLLACYAGLRARGGAPGVGRATTYAVIGGSIAVLFLDLVVGAAGYLIEQTL